jgi:hypothetical protein
MRNTWSAVSRYPAGGLVLSVIRTGVAAEFSVTVLPGRVIVTVLPGRVIVRVEAAPGLFVMAVAAFVTAAPAGAAISSDAMSRTPRTSARCPHEPPEEPPARPGSSRASARGS